MKKNMAKRIRSSSNLRAARGPRAPTPRGRKRANFGSKTAAASSRSLLSSSPALGRTRSRLAQRAAASASGDMVPAPTPERTRKAIRPGGTSPVRQLSSMEARRARQQMKAQMHQDRQSGGSGGRGRGRGRKASPSFRSAAGMVRSAGMLAGRGGGPRGMGRRMCRPARRPSHPTNTHRQPARSPRRQQLLSFTSLPTRTFSF